MEEEEGVQEEEGEEEAEEEEEEEAEKMKNSGTDVDLPSNTSELEKDGKMPIGCCRGENENAFLKNQRRGKKCYYRGVRL